MKLPRLAAVLLAAALLPLAGHAATYPSGPVTLVVPFSAGGQFDLVARAVGKALSAELGQPVIIDNVGGAGGNIAGSRVARAKPDGYTLLMYGGNLAVAKALYKKLDYDPLQDFAPISRVSNAPHVIMAARKSGITTFAQLQQQARGGKLSYGSPGVGTSMHMAMEITKDHFGLDILHVPYKGGANVMTDLVGGQVDLGIIAVGPALEFIRGNKVVPLAVTSAKRSPALPDVPSLAELGMKDMDAGSWSGLVAPKATPPEIVAHAMPLASTCNAMSRPARLVSGTGFESPEPDPAAAPSQRAEQTDRCTQAVHTTPAASPQARTTARR